jgi:hypothetical protein
MGIELYLNAPVATSAFVSLLDFQLGRYEELRRLLTVDQIYHPYAYRRRFVALNEIG